MPFRGTASRRADDGRSRGPRRGENARRPQNRLRNRRRAESRRGRRRRAHGAERRRAVHGAGRFRIRPRALRDRAFRLRRHRTVAGRGRERGGRERPAHAAADSRRRDFFREQRDRRRKHPFRRRRRPARERAPRDRRASRPAGTGRLARGKFLAVVVPFRPRRRVRERGARRRRAARRSRRQARRPENPGKIPQQRLPVRGNFLRNPPRFRGGNGLHHFPHQGKSRDAHRVRGFRREQNVFLEGAARAARNDVLGLGA